MSWIKENKFLAALGGVTLVGVVLLYFVGSQAASKYAGAKEEYEATSSEAQQYEKLSLYPKSENRDAKRKAIEDYKLSLQSLQTAFQQFRTPDISNVSPQEFTDQLLAANAETRAAFEENKVTVPEPYFGGFANYKTTLASGISTGILGYELNAIKELMLSLAKAKVTELKNLYREDLPEESGKTYDPGNQIARRFPVEITFLGTEKSVREFLTSITKLDRQYVVIRTLRITNEKSDPPKASDAQFDKPAPAKNPADIFGGGFVLPGDEPAEGQVPPADAEPVPVVAPKVADSGRILSQVLGSEQLRVFLRLDILQLLPAKKLP
jgi:hypothetical protein